MKQILRLIPVILFLIFVAKTKPAQAHSTPVLDPATEWADSICRSMTLEERVGQLIVPRYDITDDEAGRAVLKHGILDQHIGGFLLGKGTKKSYKALIDYATSISPLPLLVTLDGEWGAAMRVTDAHRYPFNMPLGAITDPDLLYDYGRQVAAECRELGVNVNFAPVLDVNSNPKNPVIGNRSFGEDPERVSLLGVAYSRGLEDGGVMSVGKHFPGHGDTSVDSHKALPTVTHDRTTLDDVDLRPFRDYIDAGLSGIMVGHLKVPSLDASGTPASLSKKITTDLLQKEMGFKGLVFTDALAMKGAVSGNVNNALAAFMAGADVILQPTNVDAAIKTLLGAVKSGKIKEGEIDRRCKKILRAKYELEHNLILMKSSAPLTIDAQQALNARLAEAAITLLKNENNVIPLKSGSKAKVVEITADTDAEVRRLSAAAAKSDVVAVFYFSPYKLKKFKSVLPKLKGVVMAYQDIPAMHKAAMKAVNGEEGFYGKLPVGVDGVASAGDGIVINRHAKSGTRLDAGLQSRIDSIIKEAIAKKAFPGCQIFVAKDGDVIIDKAYGHMDYASGSPRVTTNTLYDIASMSKATGTIAGIMRAYDEGLLDLDGTVGHYLPSLANTDLADITVRDLLFHETGLPASLNMYKLLTDTSSYSAPLTRSKAGGDYTIKIDKNLYINRHAKLRKDLVFDHGAKDGSRIEIAPRRWVDEMMPDTIINWIAQSKVSPKKDFRYSCLNFCLLMAIEESVTGVAHDQWVETEVFGPLGLDRTLYNPLQKFEKHEIAPTERDQFLRKTHLQGYVHDEVAAFSGGVQGNAGLFSTASEIGKLCQTWLDGGRYGNKPLFSPQTVDLFTGTRSRSGKRGLGFDLLSNTRGMEELGVSRDVYGHTGFTGTAFWVDPRHNLVIVFMSNRVNPSRTNAVFSQLNPRRAVAREVYKSIRK